MTLKPNLRLFLLSLFVISSLAVWMTAAAQQATPAGNMPVFATSTYTPSPSPNPFVTNTPAPWANAENVIEITLALQGRPEPPHALWKSKVFVALIPVGETDPAIADEFTTDENGRLYLIDVPHGTYQVVIRGSHSLVRIETVTVASGMYRVYVSSLRDGDANGDNQIDLSDFSLLAAAYGTRDTQAQYDARADFNGDGRIDLTDFSVLASNYGLRGETP